MWEKSMLDRFDLNEQIILSVILEQLDRDKLEIVEALQKAIVKGLIPQDLVAETLSATRDLVIELRTRQLVSLDPEVSKSLDSWEKSINSPELGIENSINVTIPIIPFLLTYDVSCNLQSGINLESIWNKLCTFIGQKSPDKR